VADIFDPLRKPDPLIARFSRPPTAATSSPATSSPAALLGSEARVNDGWSETGIKNKEWAAAAGGFGVTSKVGRSSCELEFQRPTAAEVVGSAHTFHISQPSSG